MNEGALPELPGGWVWARLGEVIDNVSLTDRKLKQSEYQEKGKIPVIDQGQNFIGGYSDREEFKISCETPVIIFGDHTKIIKYVNFDFIAGADGVKVIIPQQIFYPKLFYYFIQKIQLPDKGYARHFQFLEKSNIPIPPFPEQRRIASKIEELFTKLDTGVETLKKTQAQLKRYRQSVLKAACEGKLVPTEAEIARTEEREYETADVLLARILKERREKWEDEQIIKFKKNGKMPNDNKWKSKFKPPVFPNIEKLPNLPEGWTWASPDQISSWNDPYSLAIGPFGSNLKVSDYVYQGVPLVFVRNIRSGIFLDDKTKYVSDAKAEELRSHWISSGDILITKMGDPPGDSCLYPEGLPKAIITADCIKLRLCPLLDSHRYFVNAIKTQIVRSQIISITRGVAQKKVSLARIKTIGLPIPPGLHPKKWTGS